MIIQYKNIEDEMWIQGENYKEPNKKQIINHAKKRGFKIIKLKMWFDYFKCVWRFSSKVVKY